MELTLSDLNRLTKILATVGIEGLKVLGRAGVESGELRIPFSTEEEARAARDALIRNHLNVDIDPDSDEHRIVANETGVWLFSDVKEPLWTHPESVAPSEIV